MYLSGWRRKLPAPIDSSAAALEKALTQETYARKEGFYRIGGRCILLDGIMFPHINAPGILLMFALQVIGLIGVASMLGVDKVVILLERCTRRSDFPEAKATEARSHSAHLNRFLPPGPGRPPGNMGQLTLKRTSDSRPSGQRSDDDFDVLADGAVVGRTLKVHAAPVGTPWMWTLAFGHQKLARSKKHLRRPCVDRAEPLGLLRFVLEGSRDPARATSLGVRHARAGFS